MTGIAEDDQIRKALDKTRDVGGDYNLARAVDLLLGIVEWLHNAQWCQPSQDPGQKIRKGFQIEIDLEFGIRTWE